MEMNVLPIYQDFFHPQWGVRYGTLCDVEVSKEDVPYEEYFSTDEELRSLRKTIPGSMSFYGI